MVTFIVSIVCLVLGYIFYGRFVSHVFGLDSARETPMQRLNDGVDYIEIRPWRAFLIQLLNIAGLGPIFGAILGAAYGPIAYLWIVFGCIFMGATHDFFSGMISMRANGCSLPDLYGKFFGVNAQRILVLFSGIMLLAVGIAFVNGPADLLATHSSRIAATFGGNFFTAEGFNFPFAGTLSWIVFWSFAIIAYYVLAVILPINKIIGRIYPFFGIALLFMAVGVAGAMLWQGATGTLEIPELTFSTLKNFNLDTDANPVFPMLFVVISCGAISGFHATQSPMMARCLKNEKSARLVFYGAMIAEGVLAMIWATAAIAYCGGADGLNASGKTPAVLVDEICSSWLGTTGAIVAVIGVIICPITSGDTALRSVRLIAADALRIPQKPLKNRIFVSIPIFVAALFLSQIKFEIIWRYVGLSNQMLAAGTLWGCAAWLVNAKKSHWILSLPATFLTAVCGSYFLNAPHALGGLDLQYNVSCIGGIAFAALVLFAFVKKASRGNGFGDGLSDDGVPVSVSANKPSVPAGK